MKQMMNMPWEERPEGCSDVMWRYSKNPVIGRYHIPTSNMYFQRAVVPFGDGLPVSSVVIIRQCDEYLCGF